MPTTSSNPIELFTLEGWGGINQHERRGSIDDQELFWDENLFPISKGNLRSCWGPSDPIFTAPAGTKIVRIFFGYYGNQTPLFGQPPPGRMGWMALDDGTIWEVDLDTKEFHQIGDKPIWEPIPPKYWLSIKVWRPRYVGHALGEVGGIVIGSPLGLYAWDGHVLYSPGDVAPTWLTNDDITGLTTIMPIGLVNIYAMEVYNERLWLVGKDVVQFSVPTNGADFTASDGGGAFGYFGDKLVHDYMDVAASSGYLFFFGDSSVDVVSNVQLVGQGTAQSPFVTNFNYANVDPQVGQRFPRPVGHWGRYFVMFNGAGIWEMEGGDARNIGDKTLNIYNTVVFPDTPPGTVSPDYYPTMCPATMYGKRIMLINGKFTDPFGVKRNLLLAWHGTGGAQGSLKWSVMSQWYDFSGGEAPSTQLDLTNINSYEDNSVITPYGTDGTNLYRLFDHPDEKLPKRLASKTYRGNGIAAITLKDYKRLYMELHDNDGRGASLVGTMTCGGGNAGGAQFVRFDLPGGTGPEPTEQLPAEGVYDTVGRYEVLPQATNGKGIWCSVDLQSFSPDFTIERLHIGGEQRTQWGA